LAAVDDEDDSAREFVTSDGLLHDFIKPRTEYGVRRTRYWVLRLPGRQRRRERQER